MRRSFAKGYSASDVFFVSDAQKRCFIFGSWVKKAADDRGRLPAGRECGAGRGSRCCWSSLLAGLLLSWAGLCSGGEAGGGGEFSVRHWGSGELLAAGDIYALARTPDGFLWLATDVGGNAL